MKDLATKYGLIKNISSIRSVSVPKLNYVKQKGNFRNDTLIEFQKAIDEDSIDSIISFGSLDLITFLQ